MKKMHSSIIPTVLITIGAAIAFRTLIAQEPIWAVGLVAVVSSLAAAAYAGVLVASICLALSILGMSGALKAYASSFDALSTAAVAYLAALGAMQGMMLITRKQRRGKLYLPTILYFAFCALGALVTTTFLSAPVFAARGFLSLFFPVLIVIAVAWAITRPGRISPYRRRILLSITLLLILGANSVVALRQAFFGFTGAELVLIQSGVSTYGVGQTIRTMGLFPTNQDFGLMVACLAPAAFVGATFLTGKTKAVVVAIGALAAIALITSLTRTALIAAAVALLIGMFAWGSGATIGRLTKYGLIIGGTATALWYWMSTATNIRVQETYDRLSTFTDLSNDRSYTDRAEEVYPRAFSMISEHPFGAGAGSAGPLSQQFPDVAPFGEFNTDSGYLMIAVQIGVLGAAVLMWLLWRTMRVLAADRTSIAVAGSVAVLALLIAMTTAQYWSLSAPIALVAALIGLAFGDSYILSLRQTVKVKKHVAV